MTRLIGLVVCYFLSFLTYATEITFSSKGFAENVPMPVLYTCDGKNISPDLSWTNLPPNTQSIAIIFSDKDAPGGIFYHWVIYNIPSNITSLIQGVTTLPEGSIMGKNSWGNTQYNGPCPPKGSLHHYTFTLYALDTKLTSATEIDAPTLLKMMQGHILGQFNLKTAYTRWLV